MAKPSAITKLAAGAEFVHMALVAPSGFGKTVFCGTAPRCLILSTDPEGTLSAQKMGSEAEEWRIRSWEDDDGLVDAFRWMREEGCEEFDWLCIDNITEAQQLAKERCMELARKNNSKLDPFIPSPNDYQRSQNMLIQMIKQFHDLPINIIWTVQNTTEEDAEGDEYWGAAIHGQKGSVAQQILGYMNITGMGEVVEKDDKEIRRIWFSHRGPFRGKDRYAALGQFRDDLDVPRMVRIIDGGGSPVQRRKRPAKKTAARRRATARSN